MLFICFVQTFYIITTLVSAITVNPIAEDVQLSDPLANSATSYGSHGKRRVKLSGADNHLNFNVKHELKKTRGQKGNHHHDQADHQHHERKKLKKHHGISDKKKNYHHDEAERYLKHHKDKEGFKESKSGKKKSHKKGHKLKGYHNRLVRDEYHKERQFFDDEHESGHFSKKGNYHKAHDHQQGDKKSGKWGSSSANGDKYGKSGLFEKGHHNDEKKGHRKKGGSESHYKHRETSADTQDEKGGKHYALLPSH